MHGHFFFCALLHLFSYRLSSCTGEGQREHSAPDKLLYWKQLVHKPQRERRVCLRRRVRLHLWIRAGRAAQQKEAARGAHLNSGAPVLDVQTDSPYPPASLTLPFLAPPFLHQSETQGRDSVIGAVSVCTKRFYLAISSLHPSLFLWPSNDFYYPQSEAAQQSLKDVILFMKLHCMSL